jgi:uncharacterized membrane protein HdeD (DUF308 family)
MSPAQTEMFRDARSYGTFLIVAGVLGAIAGILALVVIIGVWLVVTGIVDFIRAFQRLENRALRLLGALVDVILGVLILALPKLSLGTLAILVGLAFLIRGVVAVIGGIGLRRAAGAAEDSASSAVTA